MVSAGYGGTVNPDTYTITAKEGYAIDTLMIDGSLITGARGESVYTPETSPTRMMVVSFWYTVYYTDPTNASITVTRNGEELPSGTIVRPGEELVITAAPDSGYILDSLKINNTEVETENNSYTYTVGQQPTITRLVGDTQVVDIGAKIEAGFVQ